MTVTAVTADILQSADIHGDASHEFSLRLKTVDDGAKLRLLFLRDFIRLCFRRNFCFEQNGRAARTPDTFDGCEGSFDSFFAGEDDASDT